MVWSFARGLALLVVIEYRVYVQFLKEALNVLFVLDYAMTRLITLCPDTKLLQEEDRFSPGGELGRTRAELEEELEHLSEGVKEVGLRGAPVLISDPSGDKKGELCVPDDSSDGYGEVAEGEVQNEGEGQEENEVRRGKKKKNRDPNENEEKEAEEDDREESDDGVEEVTLMMMKVMGSNLDEGRESEERESERDESMETANSLHSSSSSSFHSVKEGSPTSLNPEEGEEEEGEENEEGEGGGGGEEETETAGQIGNLIKELFGEGWGEEDVLNYLSQEEMKENRSPAEIEWLAFLHELENGAEGGDVGGGGERETEKKGEGGDVSGGERETEKKGEGGDVGGGERETEKKGDGDVIDGDRESEKKGESDDVGDVIVGDSDTDKKGSGDVGVGDMETGKRGDVIVGERENENQVGDDDVGEIETERKDRDVDAGDTETGAINDVGGVATDKLVDVGEVKTTKKGNDVVNEKNININDDGSVGDVEDVNKDVVDVEDRNKDIADAEKDQRNDENSEMEEKTGMDKPGSGTLSKSFSFETVDCDYIDQSESESEPIEKTAMEGVKGGSSTQHSSDSLLNAKKDVSVGSFDGRDVNKDLNVDSRNGSDLITRNNGQESEGSEGLNRGSLPGEDDNSANRKNEKDSMKLEGLLQLLLDDRHFLGGDSKEMKKMPKSLQSIQKEEDKMMNWKVLKGKDNENSAVIRDHFDENVPEKGAQENARVSEAKRKRSLSVPKGENDRKRIASGGGNYSVLDRDTKSDCIPLESGNNNDFDDDSVFGDSEDESDGESDVERYPDATKKRVKIESFSSAVSNILEEMGPNNTSMDTDDLTDYDEESSVRVGETHETCQRNKLSGNSDVEKQDNGGEINCEKVCNESNISQDLIECSENLTEETKDRHEELVSPVNRITTINRPKPSSHQKPGTNVKVEIDANLKWIREFPPPLTGPKCTCKSPGTPPWILASNSASQGHDASCEFTLESSSEHGVVSVKLRRPQCSSFSPETTSSPFQKQYSHSEIGVFHEETESLCPRQSPEGNGCSREQKDKRRLLRSLSFFSRSSQSNLSVNNGVQTSPSPSDACSQSPPVFGSNCTSFTTPRRWSRVLGCRRRNVQSCIFLSPPSFSSTNGNLPSRVRSEPNVTEKWSNTSENGSVQRKFSKVWHEKRRAVRSCIFPDPEDEDLMPYGSVDPRQEDRSHEGGEDSLRKSLDFEVVQMTTSHLSIQESECSSRTPESLVRTESSEWNESLSDVRDSKLMHSKSETPLSDVLSLNESHSQHKKTLSFNERPQSLIFIPESQINTLPREKGPRRTSIKRPQSLMIPPDIQIPKRDPSLTPPDPSQTRPRSQNRLSYRDLRILRRQPSSDGKLYYPLLTPSPTSSARIWERELSQFQRERRRNVRSWSFSPTPASIPLRVSRNPSEKWPDVTSFEQDHLALHPRKLFADQPSPVHYAAFDTVIFPWRRGDPNRSSGRSSPAPPSDSVSQSAAAPPPYYSQSAAAVPEESLNGNCPIVAPHESRQQQKDSSVWRRSRVGSGGVSRSTRKEKASSSPVFRRASLSHSEWDIRRPWSHVYSEREAAKLSQSVCRLAMTSAEEGVASEVMTREGEEGPRSLPYMPSPNHSSSEGVFQKFKKSLSLRLAKKGSRSESPSSHSAPVSHCPPEPTAQIESQTLPRRRGSINREEDNKSSFLFGHPLFRSSKERRRARLKDARSSKCNSGDSGDSGIELVTGSGHVTALDMTSSQPAEVDSNNYLDPAFVASFADDGSGPRDLNPRAVRRTHSDVGGVTGRGSLHYSRQLSTPQPIKLRPAHRLPQHTGSLGKSKSLKRSKASSHLRRSISQPLDLDKAYDTPISTLRKCRSPNNARNRRQRRPSAGNILNDDNTTSEDEIGMSDSEDFRTDLKRSLEEDEDMIVYAEALWDHVTLDSEELVFKAGDLITVIDSSDRDWWWGRICHRAGWFPAAFVRLLVNQEDHQETSSHDTRTSGPARKQSISGLSNDQIRTNVINEIISTERDFVKHLRDVVEGYLRQVRKRPDMFNDEKISSIFGNMEALYQFQSNFLKELEMCIDWKDPHKSCIGAAFIRNREKFEIYSEYCNNHPSAVSSLQELYQDQKYIHFFEACRLLQEMIDISLDGFLLTPVQKICKYPLQLQELLKYTKADHPDYASVQGALEAMRDVALLVNERKRRMECLEKIASWQITVEGWEGPELLEDSSQLIYQGDVTKGVGGSWTKEVSLFLFDHQLVYCKRDLLKRNTFVYRGRLNLDMCEIVDLPDGKDSSLNINAHNSWKIRSLEKNKWYVFSCKMASEKHKWMEAFRRERDLVAADESAGFVVAEKAKHLAKVAARNQRNRPKRPRSLWFSFGGHKKGRGSGRTLSQIQHHPV